MVIFIYAVKISSATCCRAQLVGVQQNVPEVGMQLRELLRLLSGHQGGCQRQEGAGCNGPHIAILVLQFVEQAS